MFEDASQESASIHGELVKVNREDVTWEGDGMGLTDIEDFRSGEFGTELVIIMDGDSDETQPRKGRVRDAQDFFSMAIKERRKGEEVLDDPV